MSTTPDNDGKKWAVVSIVALVVVLSLGYYLIKHVFGRPDNLQNACVEVLPQNMRVGIKFLRNTDGNVTIDLGGQKGVPTGATPQQIELFVRCLELSQNVKVTVENGVRLSLEPVGQVANRWKRESGLRLTLMPGANEEVLNNLRIGPSVGRKEDIIRTWCSDREAGACVKCDPDQPSTDAEVLVRLRDSAPVEKQKLPGMWPVPQPGAPLEPWQLVNNKGERFYYECKRN